MNIFKFSKLDTVRLWCKVQEKKLGCGATSASDMNIYVNQKHQR